MVDALKEAWRVLTPGAVLIDLRPLAHNMPIEIVDQGVSSIAGFVDGKFGERHDHACSRALTYMLNERWFTIEQKRVFDLPVYMDTVRDMQSYLSNNFTTRYASLEDKVVEQARRIISSGSKYSRVRLRHRLLLASYRKV